MEASFIFAIGEKVKTIFGDDAIIDMACVDNAKEKVYFVKLKGGNDQYLRENQLEKL